MLKSDPPAATDASPMPGPAAPDAPAPSARAFEAICHDVRTRLANGALKPGDKLPPERETAEAFGVGRNAVREALKSLENAGIVELRKGRGGGAFIRPGGPQRIVHAMQDLHDMGSYTLAELTEARILVVDQIIRLACERATEADFEALQRNVDELAHFTKTLEMQERTRRVIGFYHLISHATRNRVLVLLDTSLNEIISRFVARAWAEGDAQLKTLVASRRRVLRHLRARDADRAAAELNKQMMDLHRSLSRLLD
jgi:GntR family transcriptional regulator, transcriptional repressor for pyruvate dehydrogenase complex